MSGGVVIQGDFQPHYYNEQQIERNLAVLLDWLSDLNFAVRLQSHCNKRTPGTGHWLLDHPSFCDWLDADSSQSQVLFCRGNSGVGKTILRYATRGWHKLVLLTLSVQQ